MGAVQLVRNVFRLNKYYIGSNERQPTTFSFASAGGAAPLATGAPAVPAAEHSPGLDFFAPLSACPDAYRDIKTKSGNIPKQNPDCHQHNKQSPFVSLINKGAEQTEK